MRQPDEPEIAALLALLARERGRGRSFCPSEAARRLDPANWRALMPEVRRVATAMQAAGRLAVTQRGRPVDLAHARGPVRLRLPAMPEGPETQAVRTAGRSP